MRPLAEIVIAVIVIVLAAGYVSNAISRRSVETTISAENRESLDEVTRLWHLPSARSAAVGDSAFLIRLNAASSGDAVKIKVPPRSAMPFSYAIAKPIGPFVFRVYYGWAAGTDRVAFGEGGEKIVIAVFGKTRKLRTQPHWTF